MLKKVVSIKNVGTFRESAAGGNTELRKLTLIHAENGRGKTTLCAILRSFQSGNASLIIERKTLDSDGKPQVQLLLDGNSPITFKDGAWSSTLPNLEIFDATFVAKNVYLGDSITHDHKKNLCRAVLGAEGVELARRYDEWDGVIRTSAAELSEAKKALQNSCPLG